MKFTSLIGIGLLCLLLSTTSCSKKSFVSVNTNEIVLTVDSPEAELIITYSGEWGLDVEGNIPVFGGRILTEWFSIWDSARIPGAPPTEPTNPLVYIIRLRDDIDTASARSSTITVLSESNTEVVTIRFVPD